MDRFAHEKMRVETARLETERQKAKFLIVAENASALFKHAAASAADGPRPSDSARLAETEISALAASAAPVLDPVETSQNRQPGPGMWT